MVIGSRHEEVLESKDVYSGRVVNLRVDKVKLQSGASTTREVVEHRGAAVILAMPDEFTILMVRQYRFPVGLVLLELPAGTLELDETPETCAQRELIEETGFDAASFEKILQIYPAPGYTTELIHIFLATELVEVGMKLDEDENLEVVRMGFNEVLKKIERNEIRDCKTICGILALAIRKKLGIVQ